MRGGGVNNFRAGGLPIWGSIFAGGEGVSTPLHAM